MIQSMTGFGSAKRDLPSGAQLRCDIRTLNHKYLDASISLFKPLKPYESSILKQVRTAFHRGRIEVSLYIEATEAGELPVEISLEKARSYAEQLKTLKEQLSLSGEVDISLIASLKDIFTRADVSDIPPETMHGCIQEVVDDAIGKTVAMRKTEGKAIFEDFNARIAHLRDDLAKIKKEAKENVSLWRKKIRARVKEFSGGISVDEGRMEQEILFHALKSDITEECTRLETHMVQFEDLLSAEGTFGKKLGFLLHEMTREVNTLTAKSMSANIVESAVSLRDEIEHLREQIYNIE
jgi:uncharacterized protein (TIGR00255 family)